MSNSGQMHELLPWYMTGVLEPRLAEEFRAHLSGCDACSREMAMLEALKRELAEHGAAFLEDHPSPEKVVAATRGELSDEEAADVRKHLSLCATCAEEASWVAGEGAYGEPTIETKTPARSGWSWNWAAGIAAVLVLAALPWVLFSRPEGESTGMFSTHFLESAKLGAPHPNVFPLAKDQKAVRLIVPVDISKDSLPLTLTIVNDAGTTVHTGSDIEPNLEDYFTYQCVRRDCPPDKYELRLYGSGETEPTVVFDFEVVEP